MPRAMEGELIGICDLFAEGKPDTRWMGRAEKPIVAMRAILPRRAAGACGHLKQDEYAEVWALNRLGELASLAEIAKCGRQL